MLAEKDQSKEESKDAKAKLCLPEKFDTISFKTIKDLQPHIPADKFTELEKVFDKIIRV